MPFCQGQTPKLEQDTTRGTQKRLKVTRYHIPRLYIVRPSLCKRNDVFIFIIFHIDFQTTFYIPTNDIPKKNHLIAFVQITNLVQIGTYSLENNIIENGPQDVFIV